MEVAEFEPLLTDERGFLESTFSDMPDDLWSVARDFGLDETACLRVFLNVVERGSSADVTKAAFVLHASADGNPYIEHLATLLLSFDPRGLRLINFAAQSA